MTASAHVRQPHGCHSLLDSELLTLSDWHCQGTDMPAEEPGRTYEVVVVRHGSFVRQCNGGSTLALAGSIMLWHPDDVFRIVHPVPSRDRCCSFSLPESTLESLLGASGSAALFNQRAGERATSLRPKVHLMHLRLLQAARHCDSPLQVEELAIDFLTAALRSAAPGPATRVRPSPLAREYAFRVRAYVAEHYRESLPLARIARAVCCSPFHLCRMIRDAERTSIHQMVLAQRLNEALDWLLESDDEISVIALRVGFASHSHLSSSFRAVFGVTPSAIRSGARGNRKTVRANRTFLKACGRPRPAY